MISIIVPIYNVDRYIRRCLESILEQDYYDFELILINDGSTDDSYEICKEYACKDSRIRLINQKNSGVSVARNTGLSIAKGKWIGFVDADDYLEKDFYSRLISEAEKYDVDMACCGIKAVDSQGNKKVILNPDVAPRTLKCLSKEEILQNYFSQNHRYFCWAPWNKIIRSSIAKKYQFEEGRALAEDFFYVFECIKECNYILYDPTVGYNYFIREDSAVHKESFSEKSFDVVYFAKKARDELVDWEENIIELANLNMMMNAARYLKEYYREKNDKEKFKCYLKECREIIKMPCKIPKGEINLKQRGIIIIAKYFPALFQYI